MKSHVELTKRQLQVLPYLLASHTYEEAAHRGHVSVKQIYCWLKIPEALSNQSILRPCRISLPSVDLS